MACFFKVSNKKIINFQIRFNISFEILGRCLFLIQTTLFSRMNESHKLFIKNWIIQTFSRVHNISPSIRLLDIKKKPNFELELI